MTDSEGQPDSDPKQDSRLRSFLRRAAPIIAAERGLTSAAKIKLQSLAAEMRLPGELLDEALLDLQHASTKGRRYSRWERGYARYVAQRLKSLENGILTNTLEQKLLQTAQDKYQLSLPQAREISAEVVKQLNIRRISASDAERYVESVIKDVVGQGVWIEPEVRERLFSIGDEWGVSREHVAAFLDYYTRRNRDRQTTEQRRSTLAVAAIGVTFVVLLITIVYWGYRWTREPEPAETATRPDPATPEEPQLITPGWWDPRLQTAVANALVRYPSFREIAIDLASDTPAQRQAGLLRVAELWLENLGQRDQRDRLESLLQQLLQQEPDEALFQNVVREWLFLARPPAEGLPSGDAFYPRGLALIELAVKLSQDPTLSESRREAVREPLDELTGTFLRESLPESDAVRRYQTAYLERMHEHLVNHSAIDVDLTRKRFDQLWKLAGNRLTQAQQLEWATEVLVEVLRVQPQAWQRLQGLFDVCITEGNRENLPPLIDLLESTPLSELQDELGTLFQRKFRLDLENPSPFAIASAMRRTLGISGGTNRGAHETTRDQLARRAASSLAPRDDLPPNEIDAQLLLDLLYWGTLASELATFPERTETIQQALAAERPFLKQPQGGSIFAPSGLRPLVEMTERDARLLDRILRVNELGEASAASNFRALAQRIDEGLNVNARHVEAAVLADYLFQPRGVNDQKRLLEAVSPLRSWAALLLAVADQVGRADVSFEQARQITSSLLDLDLVLDGDQDPKVLQTRLLELAASKLSRSTTTESDAPTWFKLQTEWVRWYERRLQAFDAAAELPETSLPSDTARAVLEAFAGWATQQTPAMASDAAFHDWRTHFKSQTYLAGNDMQRTVAVQRITLELLSTWLVHAHPEHAAAAQEILETYLTQVDQRQQVVTQLFDGEQAWLKLWLLLP